MPFEGRISDVLWLGIPGQTNGTWMLAEWFGQVWESSAPTESARWTAIASPSALGRSGFLQMALFSGAEPAGRGRDEVIVAGLGTNNEWVFRAEDRLGWLLCKPPREDAFAGLIEFMRDAAGNAMPLVPFKHFKPDPDAEPPSNIRDYSLARGRGIHKDIADAPGVDISNAILSRDASGRWQRRRLPLELQVAPILDAAVVPTPDGPAWLVTFKETDGHRIFGSPGQEWPAVVYWPGTSGSSGRLVPASQLGFTGLYGEAELVVVSAPNGGIRVLAFRKDDRRCQIYGWSGR
jgi:hypothetical protein